MFAAYFFAFCANAEPAAVLAAALLLPSLSALDAAVAARGEVVLGGLTWESALPAAALEFFPALGLVSTEDACDAALLPVTFVAMLVAPVKFLEADSSSEATPPMFGSLHWRSRS